MAKACHAMQLDLTVSGTVLNIKIHTDFKLLFKVEECYTYYVSHI